MKIILLFIFCFGLISCSSISEKDCSTMNWYKRGQEDAKKGLEPSQYGKHKESCLRFGIEFDKDEYIDGFESIKK